MKFIATTLLALSFTLSSCKKDEEVSQLNYEANAFWKPLIKKAVKQIKCRKNLNKDVKLRPYQYIDPLEANLRYTQDSIDNVFGNGSSIESAAQTLAANPESAEKFTAIRIFRFDDPALQGAGNSTKKLYFSIDNRRLWVFRRAREIQLENLAKNSKIGKNAVDSKPVRIKVTLVSKDEAYDHLKKKWTTINYGSEIEIRK